MKASVELPIKFAAESLAARISELYSQWHTDRQVYRSRIAEVIKYVYATSTKETTNVSNPWSHTTHIPKLTQIHDNLGANYATALFGARDWFTFDPATQDEADVGKKLAINGYLQTKHEYNGWYDTMLTLLNDWVQGGNCFGRNVYVREMMEDPITGEPMVRYEGPKPQRISPYDIEFDATVAKFADAPKVIRSVMTLGEFLRQCEEIPELQYDPAVVAKVREFRVETHTFQDSDWAKVTQAQLDGFSSFANYMKSGKIEILEFLGDIFDPVDGSLHKDSIITVVDRRWVLRNVRSKDMGNIGQVYHVGWRKRTDNLWAQGPLDNLIGMQYLIDHLENARADGFDQMLNPDEVFVGNVETVVEGAVRKHYIDDGEGSVTKLPPDAQVLQADFQIQVKEAQMEAYAGAPREAMGIRSPGEKTAFEVESLQNAAGRLFQVKIELFERELVEPMLNGEVELAVRNLSGEDTFKVFDDDFGVESFASITQADLAARGRIKARGASHFGKRSQLVRELQGFGQALTADPAMAVHFPGKARAKVWSDAMGFDKYGLYEPFGQIAEELEKQQRMQGAQSELDKTNAASLNVGAPEEAPE